MGSRENAQAQLDKAKARLQKIVNRDAATVRKQDTRRKIILGAILMETMKNNPETRDKVMHQLRSLPRKTDRSVFENWTIEDGR